MLLRRIERLVIMAAVAKFGMAGAARELGICDNKVRKVLRDAGFAAFEKPDSAFPQDVAELKLFCRKLDVGISQEKPKRGCQKSLF